MDTTIAFRVGGQASSERVPTTEVEHGSLISQRVRAAGKFLYVGDEKLWVKGITYGTFRPDPEGVSYPEPGVVDKDFAMMHANDINVVRTYTVPPRWLLDTAARHGLRVMVGLAWEQHIAFLDDRRRARDIERRVRMAALTCSGHPAILCYAIGNEIPAPIVRWQGRRPIEQFLESLYRAAKAGDPDALVTYVNYPTTEYLQLPFLDLACFNVFLESKEHLERYIARLQNLIGDRPLLLAEIGLDSRRNGEAAQATNLASQVRTAFAAGCAGVAVFGWTDEWHRGGHDILDWDFGLTTRERIPKLALTAVHHAFKEVPFPAQGPWPLVSVVVCSYNGARTIRHTLEGLSRLDYPGYEVIVVDDGSTDATPQIAAEYDVRVISTENRGLSNARNTGWQAATGEIVAYIDDDAYPDPHWLKYLVARFHNTQYVGVGGPNVAPPGDGPIADCVANAPGGPVHVLISDWEAEQIPGCNMAFRRSALAAVGGFDPRFRAAGDDVDICWRLQERGWEIGFHAAAMVWHHRRNSIRAYWKQQQGYGKAEALLEEKWPERYNALGHLAWKGRLYGKGLTEPLRAGRWRIYHGRWGTALFQSLYEPATGTLLALPLMPEWYLVIAFLAVLSMVGFFWAPLLAMLPVLGMAVAALVAQAVLSAGKASFSANLSAGQRLKLRTVTALLHLMQPMARLIGRLRHGLTPWRRRGPAHLAFPRWRNLSIWSERWRAPEQWIGTIEGALRRQGVVVRRGGDYDRWDLEVRGGILGTVRTRMAIEEHGAGRQLLRFRLWPRGSWAGIGLTLVFAILSLWAAREADWAASLMLASMTAAFGICIGQECAYGAGAVVRAIEDTKARLK